MNFLNYPLKKNLGVIDVTNAHNEEGSLLHVAHIDDFYIFY